MEDGGAFSLDINVKSAADRVAGEREHRLDLARGLVKTGVPFLDKALKGLRRNDLLLVGASSGAGKTEFVSGVARANVAAGRRVHFFALEAEEREIERRILWRHIAQLFFSDPNRPRVPISYADWLYGELDHVLERYETQAQRIFDERYKRLYTIYRRGEFDIQEYERTLMAIRDQTDLIICDHLNYFDFDDGMDENRATTQIMKKIRDLSLLTGVPQILVAHIRKKERKSKAIMPDLEDFMGSSNVYKIATQAVLIAGAPDQPSSPTRWPTYMRIAKSRTDGSLKRFVARCHFDSERNEYEPTFGLGHWRDGMEQFEPISEVSLMPRWAVPREPK
jgi:replicative DNA helicase